MNSQNLTMDEFVREYERLYQKGVELFTEFNICDIHDNTCQKGRAQNVESFCCHGCEYLTETGCIAKALWCKLWLCVSGKEKARKMPGFKERHTDLVMQFGRLCRGYTGRWDLSDYIYEFYGNR